VYFGIGIRIVFKSKCCGPCSYWVLDQNKPRDGPVHLDIRLLFLGKMPLSASVMPRKSSSYTWCKSKQKGLEFLALILKE
jgi:hypothetical protein